MRMPQFKNVVSGCVLAGLLGGGMVFAQSETTTKTTLSAEIETLEKEVANLSPQEKSERAVEKIAAMKTVLTDISELAERVRAEERDILKLNCINEKGTAIKGFVKVSEQSFENLKAAVAQSDTQSQNHHYTLVAISGQKVSALGEEARVCAGEVMQYSDETVVDVVVDPNIAEFDFIIVEFGDYDFEYVEERLPEMTLFQ